MRHRLRQFMLICGAGAVGGTVAAAVSAQVVEPGAVGTPGAGVLVLDNWNYDPLYSEGWSVDTVLEKTTVNDPSGEAVGTVEDLLFSDEGRLVAFVVEIGGTLGVDRTSVSVPWEQAVLTDDTMRLHVPITPEALPGAEAPALPATAPADGAEILPEEVAAGPAGFLATDLIGDYVSLEDNERYGDVSDIIVLQDRIAALVVKSAGSGQDSQRAYPYAGYQSWTDPALETHFSLPYAAEQADVIEDFDYDRLIRRPAE